ncbi:MAG: hypothetical protein RL329_1292, partial [Bacteroidota bacterium]
MFIKKLESFIMDKPFIEKITLRNFKCYKELTLDLKSGINILYGVNGTGKTSILKAINIAAGGFFGDLKTVEAHLFHMTDVRLVVQNKMPYPQYQFPVEIETAGFLLDENITWIVALKKSTHPTSLAYSIDQSITRLSTLTDAAVRRGETLKLPII